MSAAGSAGAPSSARGRRVRRLLLAVAALAVLGFGLWAGASAQQARLHLLAARDALEVLRSDDGSADLGAAQRQISLAAAHAREAERELARPAPAVAAWVPLLGRSLAAERDVAGAVAAVTRAAERLLPLADSVQANGGGVDVDALRTLEDELAAAAAATRRPVDRLSRTPVGLTPGFVQDAVEQVRGMLRGVPDTLEQASAGVGAAAGLAGADGPRTLVVAVMNNAEQRGAGGYASSFAVVRADRGDLQVEPFQDVNDVAASPKGAVRVPAPDDYAARYGVYLANTTLWKNVLMSPHVPSSAKVLCEVARLRPGVPCDGVLLLDVPALASLISLVGPVTLPGGEVSGDELVQALLVEAYAEADPDDESGSARRKALRDAADRALVALLDRDLDGLPVLDLLADAAQGRHLALWSARPEEQAALVEAGIAGSIDPDGADLSLVSVNQLAASKLDYYLRRTVDVDVVVDRTEATVVQQVSLRFAPPPDLPAYVLGASEGRWRGLVDIAVGPDAVVREVTRDGEPIAAEVAPEAGAQLIRLSAFLSPGETATWTVTTTVPLEGGRYRLDLLPQPQAVDTVLTLDVTAAEDLVLKEGEVHREGPFTESEVVDVVAARPSWWDRPVELG